MSFIHEDFLLQSESAKRLYRKYAAGQPILDYHTHLPAGDIAENRRFRNLFEIWLEGDHYKWRLMRANGVPERYCTGDADPYEKFLAWAETVPYAVRSPLYHWTHLELKRYFGIDDLLDRNTAPAVWKRANAMLAGEELSAQGILARFRVSIVCTTDDPADSLAAHRRIASSSLETRVYPAFRPDRALAISNPERFNAWVDRLGAAANVDVRNFAAFLEAIRQRHDYFHSLGCRISDHGLDFCWADFCTEQVASSIFDKVRRGQKPDPAEQRQFASFMMLYFGRLDAEKNWTKQLHLGALRTVNTRGVQRAGTDGGFDAVGDWPQAQALAAYMDHLEQEKALPKMILYNSNPADNYVFSTIAGAFQDPSSPGKIQFGTPWWFLDQKQGIEDQLNVLSNTGLLARFIGMLTDSRSFMSFPRHEYFRRVLCNLLGNDMEAGLIPDSEELIGPMIENICFNNARNYLQLELAQRNEAPLPVGS